MENLEQQKRVIKLGKLFVKELNLDPGVDTFSKWMAHYIAEKMNFAEDLPKGMEKDRAEKECFETILKLWEHRWTWPNENSPFKDFEPILSLLEKINPDNDNDYYHRVILNRLYPDLEDDIPVNSNWLNVLKEIDRVSRIWIEYCLSKVVAEINSEKTKEWVDNAKELPNSNDVSIINILIEHKSNEVSEEDVLKEHEIKRLKKRINELERFKELNELILDSYKEELKKIKL